MRSQVRSSRVYSNSEKEVVHSSVKHKREKKQQMKIKRSKIHYITSKERNQNRSFVFSKFLNKKYITYFILLLLDITLVIIMARKNIVHYVEIVDKSICLSKTRNLFVGRNYITLVITIFFYGYTCFLNHFFLHRKNTKKFLIGLFFILIFLNFSLFFIFTKRVY